MTNGPLVTVLVPTYNRPGYLPEALRSVVNQDYSNIEVFVTNDGGVDVSDIVSSFCDPRVTLINGKENRGLPYRLNQALAQACGKYVCYLGDDDIFYPHHVSTLVDVLENETDCQVAYSDLYKVYCRIEADGSRTVLSKLVEVSRDFDRLFMYYFNHALHVSLMHRRDLWEKAGPYDESLNVLIDWYLTKRLVFYTDFYHIHEITGEFYAPVGDSDRISVQRRKDKKDYARNVMAIRTTRPAKPWPYVKDLSVIFLTDVFDDEAGKTLGRIWQHTFYPYQTYLAIPPEDFATMKTDMPNLVNVPVRRGCSIAEQMNAAVEACEGEYAAVVPRGHQVEDTWIEDSLYALINCSDPQSGFELELSSDSCWAAILQKDVLLRARREFPHASVRDSLRLSGVNIRKIEPDEIPFQFDQLYNQAQASERDGDWFTAAKIYEHILDHHQNEIWIKGLAAYAFFKADDYAKALQYSQHVNERRPTVDTLLTQGKVHRRRNEFKETTALLEKAEGILEGRQLQWT